MALVQTPNISLLEYADSIRIATHKTLKKQKQMEQYFTRAPIARFMANMMLYNNSEHINLLDPGAGIGSLMSACIDNICMIPDGQKPQSISVVLYEKDKSLIDHLTNVTKMAHKQCNLHGIDFSYKIKNEDYIIEYCNASSLTPTQKNDPCEGFTHVITNPPYGKIKNGSDIHELLSQKGIPAINQYVAFVSISMRLMEPLGQLVFITPRSFCNGVYFHKFRSELFDMMYLKKIHLFDSRTASFADDDVLQENVIVSVQKKKKGLRWNMPDNGQMVVVSSSSTPGVNMIQRKARLSELLIPHDSKKFIHIISDKHGSLISTRMRNDLKYTLNDLGISVSTGKVVDFRIREALLFEEKKSITAPLVRPFNIIIDGKIQFPIIHKKHHNFIRIDVEFAKNLLVSNNDGGSYVLVKRFTTKEQQRRVVAAVWSENTHQSDLVGFENRINYFHNCGKGLKDNIAKGMSLFLNSTLVDLYFRQFNGSTQVNATDLEYLRYPSIDKLKRLGKKYESGLLQDEINDLIEKIVFR